MSVHLMFHHSWHFSYYFTCSLGILFTRSSFLNLLHQNKLKKNFFPAHGTAERFSHYEVIIKSNKIHKDFQIENMANLYLLYVTKKFLILTANLRVLLSFTGHPREWKLNLSSSITSWFIEGKWFF